MDFQYLDEKLTIIKSNHMCYSSSVILSHGCVGIVNAFPGDYLEQFLEFIVF